MMQTIELCVKDLPSDAAVMARILLVEDEKQLSGLIVKWLKDEAHVVETSTDGLEAIEQLKRVRFDLILLDIMLPGLDGIQVCKRYRAGGGAAPILMLTAKRSVNDKETGLDSGADDYLTKPFKLRELTARIRALLRRPVTVLPTLLKVEDLTLDPATGRVFRAGNELRLVPKEYALLEVLMRNAGKTVRSDNLISSVWGDNSNVSQETIRSYIRLLRQKVDLPQHKPLIQTVHGVGHRIGTQDV